MPDKTESQIRVGDSPLKPLCRILIKSLLECPSERSLVQITYTTVGKTRRVTGLERCKVGKGGGGSFYATIGGHPASNHDS